MAHELAAEFFDESLSQPHGISFYDDVNILDGFLDQEVAHRPPHKVTSHVQRRGLSRNPRQQILLLVGNQLRVEHEASQVLLHKNNFTLIIGAMNLPTVS